MRTYGDCSGHGGLGWLCDGHAAIGERAGNYPDTGAQRLPRQFAAACSADHLVCKRQQAQLGGAARMGATLTALRSGKAHSITVAAGDLIGASPLESAYFLDEPSIAALSRMGLDLAAVGNHEFDRGTAELRRIQDGGCAAFTAREPCRLEPFAGAGFTYLAANVVDEGGATLFPGTALRQFGTAKVGFIGMTLRGTQALVSPAATAGYSFADEAETANAQARRLREAGADAVVLLIHEGGWVDPSFNERGCPGLNGSIVPILERLDPAIRLVVSGHTHSAYVCEMPASDGSARLLTSAGRYGNFVTEISLSVDPVADAIVGFEALNRPVRESAGEQPEVAALVERYVAATAPIAARVVGRIEGSLEAAGRDVDFPLANLIADAQLAATRDQANGAAQMAFINSGGLRLRFAPAADGSVTYGQVFALQPFGNTLVVLELTGAQIARLLEQQFNDETPARVRQSLLIPSAGLTFAYDRKRPSGSRVVALALDGVPITPDRTYRVTVNNFLASGGDGFSVLTEGEVVAEGGLDLDALEAFIAQGVRIAPTGRITDATPAE
jgi:5'-nucleotidase